MADKAAMYVGKRAFKKQMANRQKQDPYHYYTEAIDKRGNVKTDRKGKPHLVSHKKDTKYFMSIGIPEPDAKRLASIKWRAMALDGKYKLLGVRFGVSSLIGLIPAAGDAIDGALALLLVQRCGAISGGLDPKTRNKMYLNVVIDILIGLTPVLGDIADTFWRCNTKNANLLEKVLIERVAARAAGLQEKPRHVQRPGGRLADGYGEEGAPQLPPRYESIDHGQREVRPAREGREKASGWAGKFSRGGKQRVGTGGSDAVPTMPMRRDDAGVHGGRF